MKCIYPHYPHFDTELGASEKQTGPYVSYGKGALHLATPLYTKNISGASLATWGKQDGALRKVRNEK